MRLDRLRLGGAVDSECTVGQAEETASDPGQLESLVSRNRIEDWLCHDVFHLYN